MKDTPIYLQKHKVQCSQCSKYWFTDTNPDQFGTYEPCPHCWANGSYHCPPFSDDDGNCSLCNVQVRTDALKATISERNQKDNL